MYAINTQNLRKGFKDSPPKQTYFILNCYYMYYINFYVPEDELEKVKSAMFTAGAGQLGNYSNCAWQTKGVGQFYAKENANPAIGKKNEITKVVEYKVEMLCCENFLSPAISALKKEHPYEEPAFFIIKDYEHELNKDK